MHWKKALASLICFSSTTLIAVDVGTQIELQDSIIDANDTGPTSITFDDSITLSNPITNTVGPVFMAPLLRPLSASADFSDAGKTIVIDGTNSPSNHVLSGGGNIRGFFARGGNTTIRNLTIDNCKALGGDGGLAAPTRAGGNAGGLGGGLFVATGATVTLENTTFSNCKAQGGDASPATVWHLIPGVGGRGLHGGILDTNGINGGGGFYGSGDGALSFAGGGGGAQTDGIGVNGVIGAGGDDFSATAAGGGGAASAGAGLPGGDGASGQGGGGGGPPAAMTPAGKGGVGGYGGGGGGGGYGAASPFADGGDGGDGGEFGGGGGGGQTSSGFVGGNGGNGGFGAGGGMGGGSGGTSSGTGLQGGDGGKGGFAGGGGGGGFAGDGIPGAGGAGGFGGGNGGVGGMLAPFNERPAGGGGAGAGFGGAIFVQNGGTLNIANNITFSSNTVQGGAASTTDGDAGIGAAGSSGGQDIYAMAGAQLNFNLTSDVSLTNPIEGNVLDTVSSPLPDQTTGGLTKTGGSLLTLNGDNTYTGITRASSGGLRINGSVVSEIIVETGATLSGEFTAKKQGTNPNSGNLRNEGVFSPGNGVGNVIIEGDYTQTVDGRLVVDLTPDGMNDVVTISAGNASLAGTLEVVLSAGNYIAGTTHEIITGPSSGAFIDPPTKTGAAADSVEIEVSYGSVTITILDDVIFEFQDITSGLGRLEAACITGDPIIPGTDFARVVELLGTLSDKELNRVLVNLTPVQFGALEWINARNNSYVADILSQHTFELCCSPRDCNYCDCNQSVWITGFGSFMDNRKRLDNLEKFDATSGGVLAGIDFCSCPSFYFGGALGYTHTDLDWNTTDGSGKINSYYGALYGSSACGCFTGDFAFIGGGSDHDLKRKIKFTGLNRTAKSDVWGYFFTAHLGGQVEWNCGCATFEPFALADYHYFHRNSFKEKGADSLDLDVRGKDQHMLRGEAGLRGYYTVSCGCFCYAPYLGASWIGEFPLHDSDQKANYRGRKCVIDAESYDSAEHLGSPEAGVKVTYDCGFSFLLGYKGLFNSDVRINQAEVRLEWIF